MGIFQSAEAMWMVEGNTSCATYGQPQLGSAVSKELTHVRTPLAGTLRGLHGAPPIRCAGPPHQEGSTRS